MTYEEYLKKYQKRIEENKKVLETPEFQEALEYFKSQEYKKNLEIVRKKEKTIHKNICKKIDMLQKKLIS